MLGSKNPGAEVIMTLKAKIYFVIIAASYFVAVLFALAIIANAEEVTAHAAEQEIVIGPGQHHLSLTSVKPWIVDGEVVGTAAAYVYDDTTTQRAIDYWELYDQDGDLLVFGWFDQFGIQRDAIDEGILNGQGKLDGTFVLIINDEFM
jgi:hypothetical protein